MDPSGVILKAMRLLARLHAALSGQFWLPCHGCGRMYGGHEWSIIDGHFKVIPVGDQRASVRRAKGICPACTRSGVGCRAYAAWGTYHFGCRFAEPDIDDPAQLARLAKLACEYRDWNRLTGDNQPIFTWPFEDRGLPGDRTVTDVEDGHGT